MAGGLKKLRQRFGISAPKVAVRTHVPWYVRWLLLAVLLSFSVALAAWMYDAGRRFAGFDQSEVRDELAAMRNELQAARGELGRLRATTNAADSKLSIERSAQSQLAKQIRSLEQDNARLREDLDADDFAVIDLVEGVIAELGERTVGFSIDDEDLVELRTVRDAVECISAGLRSGQHS